MVQIIETSAVKALLADMLPWDREAVLDEYRPIVEDDDLGEEAWKDCEPWEAVGFFGADSLLENMDLSEVEDYYMTHTDEWEALKKRLG